VLGVEEGEQREDASGHDHGDPTDLLGDGARGPADLDGRRVGGGLVAFGRFVGRSHVAPQWSAARTLASGVNSVAATVPVRPHPGENLRRAKARTMPQGTVKSYDSSTQTSVLLTDGLLELSVDREAFAASGLLELRIGQRVRFELRADGDDESRVTNLNIVSL
jgi:cold shock CspA family protein